MKMEIELWHLILLLLAFLGCVAGFGKILLDQVEKRMAERFAAQDRARDEGGNRMRQAEDRVSALASRLETLTQELSALKAAAEIAPSHDDIARVYADIARVSESISSLSATVHQLVGESRGQSDTLRLILNQITQKGMK